MPSFGYSFQFYFNPLPRKEGDYDLCQLRARQTNFNPLPRKEGDSSTLRAAMTP